MEKPTLSAPSAQPSGKRDTLWNNKTLYCSYSLTVGWNLDLYAYNTTYVSLITCMLRAVISWIARTPFCTCDWRLFVFEYFRNLLSLQVFSTYQNGIYKALFNYWHTYKCILYQSEIEAIPSFSKRLSSMRSSRSSIILLLAKYHVQQLRPHKEKF